MINWDEPLGPTIDDIDYKFDWGDFLTEEGDTFNGTPVVTLSDEALAANLTITQGPTLVDGTDDDGNVVANAGVVVWFKIASGNEDDPIFAGNGTIVRVYCDATTTGGRERRKTRGLRLCLA